LFSTPFILCPYWIPVCCIEFNFSTLPGKNGIQKNCWKIEKQRWCGKFRNFCWKIEKTTRFVENFEIFVPTVVEKKWGGKTIILLKAVKSDTCTRCVAWLWKKIEKMGQSNCIHTTSPPHQHHITTTSTPHTSTHHTHHTHHNTTTPHHNTTTPHTPHTPQHLHPPTSTLLCRQ